MSHFETSMDSINEESQTFLPRNDSLEELLATAHEQEETDIRNRVYLKHYWKVLLLVAVFYALPSLQFVVVQYTGREDNQVYCYYNLKCAKDVLGLQAFNNVISNVGYIVAGIYFLVLVRYADENDSTPVRTNELQDIGLHTDMSLYYCLGWSIILEGIFSAIYHVCPSTLNFQFDTTFMIVGASLLFITLYQKRHPFTTSGAFRAYAFLAGITLMNMLALLNVQAWIFWLIVILVLVYVSLVGSLHLYYFEKSSTLTKLWHMIAHPSVPQEKFRFAMIMTANVINLTFAITIAIMDMNSAETEDFPSFVLGIIVLDSWIYLFYYICNKYRNGERLYLRVWITLGLMVVISAAALWAYNIPVSNKFLSPADSEKLNKPCVLFNFFDYHDIWHFLSALSVVLLFLAVYWMDMDIKELPRSAIRVF